LRDVPETPADGARGDGETMAATIEVEVDQRQDLTTCNVVGPVSADEIIHAIEDFYAGEPTRKVLWILTEASFDDLTSEDVRRIAQTTERFSHMRKTGKTALVFSGDIGFGLGRMHEAFRDLQASPVRQESFRSLDDALQWLKD
jgi:hypothetical protein